MGAGGEDLLLSPAAQRCFPFSIECKNQEALNIWKALEQAQQNAKTGRAPLLIFKRNKSDVYAVLPLDVLINLVQHAQQPAGRIEDLL